MPFLRVVRDKRGYETTYLIHASREGTPHESRVLYVFRSPIGVRLGREPFEADVRRQIEAGNPDVTFNWAELVSSQQVIDATLERRPRRKPPGDASTQPPVRRVEAQPANQPPRLMVPGAIEGDTPELQMRFLAHWHGILCEQLPMRIADAERRESLLAITQRLNPAGWIDADEIAAGLAGAREALERLSRVFSKRRRKSKRGGTRGSIPATDSPQTDAETNASESSAASELNQPDVAPSEDLAADDFDPA